MVLSQKCLLNLELFLCSHDHLSPGPKQQLPKKDNIPCSQSPTEHTWSYHSLVKLITEFSPGTWVLLANLLKSLSQILLFPISTPYTTYVLTPLNSLSFLIAWCSFTLMHVLPFCLNCFTTAQSPLSLANFQEPVPISSLELQFSHLLFSLYCHSTAFIPLITITVT